MSIRLRNNGFSLVEVMISAGILAIGLVFIAGTFPVGVKMTTTATERTIAGVVADEAAAKIQLYGVDPDKLVVAPYVQFFNEDVLPIESLAQLRTNFTADEIEDLFEDEPLYPSNRALKEKKKYNWSALCRRVGLDSVRITVFVCRKAGAGAVYPQPNISDLSVLPSDPDYGRPLVNEWNSRPIPVKVGVIQVDPDARRLQIDTASEKTCINGGSVLFHLYWDGTTFSEKRYKVVKRDPDGDADNEIELTEDWAGNSPDFVWVVPPARGSGRYPCIGIFGKLIETSF